MTISESLKLLLSTYFFYREWLQRRQESIHRTLSTEDDLRNSMEEKDLCDEEGGDTESEDGKSERAVDARYWTLGNPNSDLGSFFQACRDELPSEVKFGFAQLALFYVLINNTVRISTCQRSIMPLTELTTIRHIGVPFIQTCRPWHNSVDQVWNDSYYSFCDDIHTQNTDSPRSMVSHNSSSSSQSTT